VPPADILGLRRALSRNQKERRFPAERARQENRFDNFEMDNGRLETAPPSVAGVVRKHAHLQDGILSIPQHPV
jgi:hypothetical protein